MIVSQWSMAAFTFFSAFSVSESSGCSLKDSSIQSTMNDWFLYVNPISCGIKRSNTQNNSGAACAVCHCFISSSKASNYLQDLQFGIIHLFLVFQSCMQTSSIWHSLLCEPHPTFIIEAFPHFFLARSEKTFLLFNQTHVHAVNAFLDVHLLNSISSSSEIINFSFTFLPHF